MSTTLELLRDAHNLLTAVEGLPPDEMDARIAAWLDNATDKAAALQAVITRAESQEAFLKREADALTAAAKGQARAADRCRALIVDLLRAKMAIGEPGSIQGPGWTLSLRETQAVDVSDLDALPPAFWREKTTREPDKGAIKAEIEAGNTVPGAALKVNHSVTIRKAKA